MVRNRRFSRKIGAAGLAIWLILVVGILTLALSIFYSSLILAFAGLSLTFWGALLLYIRPSRYVRSELLVSILPPLTNMNKIVKEGDIEGKAVYLPPKYLKNPELSLIFIPSKKGAPLPNPEEIDEEKLFSKNPGGMFLTPPGLTLNQQLEKTLGTTFTKIDLPFLIENLPKLLIEELEIAQDVNILADSEIITVELNGNTFAEVCKETTKLEKIYESIGCPLCSAIACALAKATGKPIVIEKEERSKDDATTKIQFRVLQEKEHK